MSTKFGVSIELISGCFEGEFTIHDIHRHLNEPETLTNDTKIRYHLKRLGYQKRLFSNTNFYSKSLAPIN